MPHCSSCKYALYIIGILQYIISISYHSVLMILSVQWQNERNCVDLLKELIYLSLK